MMTWEQYLAENAARFEAELADLVRIPSVSALRAHMPDVERAAAWVADRLRAAGTENVAVMPTGGHPVVYGDWLHAGADRPTVLIYGHFDVQPADPLEKWHTPPFEPVIKSDRMIGRGASDDKAGLMTPILAVEALLRTTGALPVNVKFCFEGQEEIGSPQLGPFLEAEKARFAADFVLSADGLMWSGDTPMMLLGLKGLCSVEIHVTGPSSDLHSGLYGGIVKNPVEALADILASLRHPDGTIAIDGFYADVVPITDDERARYAEAPADDAALQAQLDVPAFFGEPGYTNRERNWARPTLDINGIQGGFQGDGTKTVIPSTASAKITCRLVADQDPEIIAHRIADHVARHAPAGVRVETVILDDRAYPVQMPLDHPLNPVLADVMTEVFGNAPYYARVGGSIPVVSYFERSLGALTFNFGWSAPDEFLHAPNEFVRLENFRRGQRAYCLVLERLAQAL